MARTKEVDPQILSAGDRKEFKAAIIRRQNQIMSALKMELENDIDAAVAKLRDERGVCTTTSELNTRIEEIDEQIVSAIKQHLGETTSRIKLQIVELDDEYDRKDRELKERHAAEWKTLRDERKAKKQGLKNGLRQAEDETANKYCTELMNERKLQQRLLETTRRHESEIRIMAQRRQAFARQYRGKLEIIIQDSASRALEGLLYSTTIDEARALINQIPTVNEAMELCQQGSEGLLQLIQKLSPGLKLPALPPSPMEGLDVDADEEEEDEVIIANRLSDGVRVEGERWAIRDRDSEHEEVYGDDDDEGDEI